MTELIRAILVYVVPLLLAGGLLMLILIVADHDDEGLHYREHDDGRSPYDF